MNYHQFIDWKSPNYDQIFEIRVRQYAALREREDKTKGTIQALKEYYSENIPQFINDWGCTYDPRKTGKGEIATMPFILFERQEQFINWLLERWKNGERGLAEKSRDTGVTWLASATLASLFLFVEDFAGGFGSRKEDLVDRAQDPKSIFYKIRKFLELLPPEFKPKEFATNAGFKRHSQHMLITNPENGSTLTGEAGDEIGRGDRTSITVVDEAAFLARPLIVEASLSMTTDCRIDISSVNGTGNVFYENRQKLPKEQVFIFDWTEDPRKRTHLELHETEEPWFIKTRAENDSTVFASEVLRDYGASIANIYVPSKIVIEAEQVPVTNILQRSETPWSIGIDAARSGNNESVIHPRRGRVNEKQIVVPGMLDGHELAGQVIDLASRLLKSAPVALIGIELDGPGVSAYDVLKRDKTFGKIVVGVHTGKKLKDGRNLNLRAWLNRQAKEYLEEGGVHIKKDPVFRSQATSFLHTFNGGKLVIESKEDYKRRFARGKSKVDILASPSPDRWDAFVLSFILPKGRPITNEVNDIWMPRDAAMYY